MTAPTRDEVIQMAREAGLINSRDALSEKHVQDVLDDLERLVATAYARGVTDERDACAKVCDDKAMRCETKAQEAIEAGENDEVSAIRSTAWQISVCGAAIRARATTTTAPPPAEPSRDSTS